MDNLLIVLFWVIGAVSGAIYIAFGLNKKTVQRAEKQKNRNISVINDIDNIEKKTIKFLRQKDKEDGVNKFTDRFRD